MTDGKNTDVERPWADEAMFEAEPIRAEGTSATGVLPKVHLLWMTPDPLGAIAAACRMYEGKPTYDLADITSEERRHYWKQARSTHLKAPLEFVKFHFFIEGVDRAFTHQMVRQRTAVYAQESMRFAVKENILDESSLPTSLAGTEPDDGKGYLSVNPRQMKRDVWDRIMRDIQNAYNLLIEEGMPAEEARGLLPHAVTTRLNYATDLRALLDHAGNRLCTQAQFHWRLVFSQIAQAISGYNPQHGPHLAEECESIVYRGWQFEEIANVFRPVCYELNRCPFQASFDRHCVIRERVQNFAAHGVPSDQWHEGEHSIHDSEWWLNPAAARRRSS